MPSNALRQLAMFKPEPNFSLLHWVLIALRSAEGLADNVVALNKVMLPIPFVYPYGERTWLFIACSGCKTAAETVETKNHNDDKRDWVWTDNMLPRWSILLLLEFSPATSSEKQSTLHREDFVQCIRKSSCTAAGHVQATHPLNTRTS